MRVEVENVGPCKKKLKIEIPAEKVTEELEKTYSQLNDSVAMPGFRRGHAPRWLMESKFGKSVNEDAAKNIVSDSYEEAVKENNLHPIGTPKFDEDIKIEAGKPLAFAVELEVHPEFEIEKYDDLALEKKIAEPTDEEVEKRIEFVRRRYAKLEEVEKGSPKKEDLVQANIKLMEGEKLYREVPNHQFIVGDSVLLGMTADETTELVKKAKIGKAVDATVKIPEGYSDEAKRGAEMTLSLTIEKIRRPVLPELTEEWVKEVGFDSVDEFKKEVKVSLEREKEREAEVEMNKQLDEQLVKKVDFEMPADLINSMSERAFIRRELELRQQGMPAAEIEKQVETLKQDSKTSVEKEIKLFFILEKIAEKERIFVTEDEVDARMEQIASAYGRSGDQIRREFETTGRMGELRQTMREDKVRQLLIEKNAPVKSEAKAEPKHAHKHEHKHEAKAEHEPKKEHKAEHKPAAKTSKKK